MALTKITKSGLTGDVVDETKIVDNAISEEHLDATAISGNTALGETAADNDFLLIYDSSAGTLKKVLTTNVGIQVPTISSVSPTNALTGDGTGNATFTITGTNFDATATAKLVTTGGTEVNFDTVTRDSSTQITGVIAISSLSNANEPYDVKVINGTGLATTLADQINIDAQPIFNTASGSVGSFQEQTTISTIDIEAYDPESAGNVTFEIQSGSLPAGLSATTVNENGVSKYRITGTLTADVASDTTSNFTLRAVDAASNTTSRAFSITVTPYNVESFTSSGTFSVPSGITSVDVLVVAGGASGGQQHGGGGGAGGLIFMPGYPVTPGGTVSVTVGCGGVHSCGTGYVPGSGGGVTGSVGTNGQDSVFGTLTAKGGGGGSGYLPAGNPGGSGGGATCNPVVGTGTQPTQPGNSGAYGFGNPGAPGLPATPNYAGGGGGGAGAPGSPPPGSNGIAGDGGDGRAYTIADGTTPVYYAGGGGGGGHIEPGTAALGGQGGGGDGGLYNGPADAPGAPAPAYADAVGQPGTANRGGGGGGGATNNVGAASGGKGIVIVTY